jgi:hypothetical protein
MWELKFAWRQSTLIIQSLTASEQSIVASIQMFPDSTVYLLFTGRPLIERLCFMIVV